MFNTNLLKTDKPHKTYETYNKKYFNPCDYGFYSVLDVVLAPYPVMCNEVHPFLELTCNMFVRPYASLLNMNSI